MGIPLFSATERLVRRLAYEVAEMFGKEELHFPSFVLKDSSALHYLNWSEVVFRERESPWAKVLWEYYLSDSYRRLNRLVHGNWILAKYATYHFLKKLSELKRKEGAASSEGAPQDEREALVALTGEAKRTSEEVQALEFFSHFGLPVERYLKEPERLRSILSNEIIVSLLPLFREAVRQPDFSIARVPAERGVPLGVKRIERFSELPKVLPQDFADETLFSYHLATNTLRVREEYGGVRGYVVYLDKSGSMAAPIPYREGSVPKISFATASALALAGFVRRYGGEFVLKFFDSQVHDEAKDFNDVLNSLLTIRAEGGTNVTEVLKDAQKYGERRIFVITDGIDEVSEEAAKSSKHLDMTFIFIKTTNNVIAKYFRCVHLERADPRVLLRV